MAAVDATNAAEKASRLFSLSLYLMKRKKKNQTGLPTTAQVWLWLQKEAPQMAKQGALCLKLHMVNRSHLSRCEWEEFIVATLHESAFFQT